MRESELNSVSGLGFRGSYFKLLYSEIVFNKIL